VWCLQTRDDVNFHKQEAVPLKKYAASVVMLEKAGNLLYFEVGSGRKIPMTVLRI
jgi:hypothetical protein